MDNAAFHRKSKRFDLAQQNGFRLFSCLNILQTWILSKTFGPGSSRNFAIFFLPLLVFTMFLTVLLKLFDYNRFHRQIFTKNSASFSLALFLLLLWILISARGTTHSYLPAFSQMKALSVSSETYPSGHCSVYRRYRKPIKRSMPNYFLSRGVLPSMFQRFYSESSTLLKIPSNISFPTTDPPSSTPMLLSP